MHPFVVMAGLTGHLLQFPGEGGGAEDGGVGLLELGEDELHLAAPERNDVLVHGLADGFLQELAEKFTVSRVNQFRHFVNTKTGFEPTLKIVL